MTGSRSIAIWIALLTLTSFAWPCASSAADAPADTTAALVEMIRGLMADKIDLAAQLATAQIDSSAAARHWEIDRQLLQLRIEFLEEQVPRWYERPGFVALASMGVTVLVLGQMVQVSF